jgi:hypothetical protein
MSLLSYLYFICFFHEQILGIIWNELHADYKKCYVFLQSLGGCICFRIRKIILSRDILTKHQHEIRQCHCCRLRTGYLVLQITTFEVPGVKMYVSIVESRIYKVFKNKQGVEKQRQRITDTQERKSSLSSAFKLACAIL